MTRTAVVNSLSRARALVGPRMRRWAALVALLLLVLGGYGDGVRAAYTIQGIDPLGVLELKIRPNVILVLDSSGSMQLNLAGNTLWGGDHPRSKLFLAKEAVRQVVADNQFKVNFMFGTYRQSGYSPGGDTDFGSDTPHLVPGDLNRFRYYARNLEAPTASTLYVRGPVLTTGVRAHDRGIESWQIIRAQWNTLYFQERVSGTTDVNCAVSVPVQFYQTHQAFATALGTAMGTCPGRGASANQYTVTFNTGTSIFTIAKTAASTKTFAILWNTGATRTNTISGALGMNGRADTARDLNSKATRTPYALLHRSNTTTNYTENFDPDGSTGPLAAQNVTHYQMRAARLWNGETIKVTTDGGVCDVSAPGTTSSVVIQLVTPAASCTGTTSGAAVEFKFAGSVFAGNATSCGGFQARSPLVPCDLDYPPNVPAAPLQTDTIAPYIDNEIQISPTTGLGVNYQDSQDGTWRAFWTTPATQDSAKASGSTPIGTSLLHIKEAFVGLWNNGQSGTTTMTGPPPYEVKPFKEPVANPENPRAKTIVLFVTDGDDTCAEGASNAERRAARFAERLYNPDFPSSPMAGVALQGYTYPNPLGGPDLENPAASVPTYVIGYGNSTTPAKLNLIAWGGSGMDGAATVGISNLGTIREMWNGTPTPAQRAACKTCNDALIAPDAETLRKMIQGIIDQGASDGEFSAAGGGASASLTETVWEYVDRGPAPVADPFTGITPPPFDPLNPATRYGALVPTRFVSTFTLPGFKGQLKAYQNEKIAGVETSVERWSAGDKLTTWITSGMTDTCTGAAGYAPALAGQCVFAQLTGGATYINIETSSAAIKRRIFTTEENGYFAVTATNLINQVANKRVALWPPQATPAVDPAGATLGKFDAALGLPLTTTAADLTALQTQYGACRGTPLPTACGSAQPIGTRVGRARKEARQMILAFLAGAEVMLGSDGYPARVTGASATGEVLYKAKPWALPESTLATAAVVTPPLSYEPASYKEEYTLFRDGARGGTGDNPDSAGTQIKMGFGLRNPDGDKSGIAAGNEGDLDTRAAKPVMTVVYLGTNDGIHAFRAGPNCPSKLTCTEMGGEELWGFVPFDQLRKLATRLAQNPEGRTNHSYINARGLRFADVFVREDLTNVNIGGVTVPSMKGVWRRVMLFGRGAGGKYYTALDITAPGKFGDTALSTTPPIPLWNRGNPDTVDGTTAGTKVNGNADYSQYLKMGESWSLPGMGWISPSIYSARKPLGGTGVEFVAVAGSGYGTGTEGSTIYTLDVLTGDVVRAADVLPKTGQPSGNAIVANAVMFVPGRFEPGKASHFAAFPATRAYVGDLHGQVWKILLQEPQGSALQDQTALLAADLGSGQPIATPAALVGLKVNPAGAQPAVPFIYGATGNDIRYDGPFKFFALRDDGNDTDISSTGSTAFAGITTYAPVTLPTDLADGSLFVPRVFDQGDGGNTPCTGDPLPDTVFRGDVQPYTAFDCNLDLADCKEENLRAVVFFSGNRLNLPNTRFAPPTPFKYCTGEYPCRSTFDSIVYALGATSGEAAYDLGGSDDSYRIFYNSRTGAVNAQADPDPGRGGTRFNRDETLVKGVPKPPPPAGIPPTTTVATANVIPATEDGKAVPSVVYGSSVCR